jgi:hypothetical protein
MSSIVAGEAVYVGLYFKVLPASLSCGFLPVVPVMIAAFGALVAVSLLTSRKGGEGAPALSSSSS